MNKRTSSAREHYGLAVLLLGGIFIGCVLIYVLGIVPLQGATKRASERNLILEEKLELSALKIRKAKEINADLTNAIERLNTWEQEFPEGDVYLWVLKKLQEYEQTMPIHIDNVSPPKPQEPEGYPKVPYGSTVYTISGRSHYHDFGFFLADFENNFPLFHLRRLELEPMGLATSDQEQNENLLFKLEFSTINKTVNY